ncbi:MAG: hypothetical protein M1269_10685 [Chloroflexi bacterium]|nr:hypothetical protein [Chloroflexota bacterium]
MMNDREKAAAGFVLERVGAMDEAFMRMKPVWDADYQYYQSRPDPARNPNDSNLFVPRTREIVEAIQPRIAGDFLNITSPFIDVAGRSPEDQDRAEVVKLWLFFRMQEMNLPLQLLPYIKQGIIYGSTVGMVVPDYRKSRGNKTKGGEGDVFFPVDLYNYRIDPEATSHDDAFDEAIKTTCRLEDLKADAESGVPYRNLEEVKAETVNIPDAGSRLSHDGSGADYSSLRNVTRIEWWGPYPSQNKKGEALTRIVLANEVCILIEEDPFKNGRSPFVFGRFEFDPFEIYGTGIPRMLRPLQMELNEIRNLRLNLLHRFISPMLLVREGALVNPEEVRKWRPFGLVRVRSGEPINNVIMPLMPGGGSALSGALTEEAQVNQDIQKRSAVPEYVRGITTELGQQTATEFSQKLAQASIVFAYNFKLLAEESLKNIARLILEHDQAGSMKGRIIRVLGSENSAKFLALAPEDIKGEYDFFPVVDPSNSEENIMRDILLRSITPLASLDEHLRKEGKKINWGEISEKFVKRMKLEGSAPIVENDTGDELETNSIRDEEAGAGFKTAMDIAGNYGRMLARGEGVR